MNPSTIVFDCEIVRCIPPAVKPDLEYCRGWSDHANMGISTICVYDYLSKNYRVFLQDNFAEFIDLVQQRNVIIGFNSLSFDDKLCAAHGISVRTTYDLLCEVRAASGQPREYVYGRTRRGYSLEPAPAFAKRKYCDYSCRSRAMMAARAALNEQAAPSEPPTLTDPAYGGPPAPVEVTEEFAPVAAPERPKDPIFNRPVRPVKLPSTTPLQRPPVPPPSLQARLPDPRPQAAPYTVTEGEVIERADFGTCPNEGCGERLNAFGKCRNCARRSQWLKGQRARLGEA